MYTYIALLRAVNLAGRARLPMNRLRELTEAAGGHDARTYLNSGNVVFDSEHPSAAQAATALGELLTRDGLNTAVMVRTGEHLLELATAGHPDAAHDPDHTHLQVAFPLAAITPQQLAAMPIPGNERATLRCGEICLHYPDGLGRSTLTTARLHKHLGTPVTCRNWRTVAALAELARTR
ncbi:DUF1697 domain-containing protein [Saccharopolyspora halophila]|uniref:DUF1697 domain-containing protein n=1 Tax=Saccharopolyspora halophila TaxID=405551 RepID=A0ABN3GIS1_9PSEU